MSCPELSEHGEALLQVRHQTKTLRECVTSALEDYFAQLGDHDPGELFRMVMSEVEQPLLEVVMHRTGGNQTKAAELLGINRSTLRKKLRQYGLD